MAWRAMRSLLQLLEQVNELAPERSKASDGLIGDAAHQARNSAHNPHKVPGVGDEIVTAEDLTHDPAHGFDSYAFAEVLRLNRDKRIKYVISNGRIFYSYSTPSHKAWTWVKYTGSSDPHVNHAHVETVENATADTRTPWNLEGLDMPLSDDDIRKIWAFKLGSSGPNTGFALQASYQGVTKIAAQLPSDLVARFDAVLAAAKDAKDKTVVLGAEPLAALTALRDAVAALPDAVAEELTDREAEAEHAHADALEAAQ